MRGRKEKRRRVRVAVGWLCWGKVLLGVGLWGERLDVMDLARRMVVSWIEQRGAE